MATSKTPLITNAELGRLFSDPDLAKRYPPILTVSQAADLLQVSQSTIYDYKSRGKLDGCARKVGKHLRIYRDALIHKFF